MRGYAAMLAIQGIIADAGSDVTMLRTVPHKW